MKCKCDNCTWEGDEEDLGRTLHQIHHLAERLDPGGETPIGECPECDCLAYIVKEPVPLPVSTKGRAPGPIGCIDTSNYAHDYRLTKPNGDTLPLVVEANDHSEQRATAAFMALAYNNFDDLVQALQAVKALALPGATHIHAVIDAALAKAGIK